MAVDVANDTKHSKDAGGTPPRRANHTAARFAQNNSNARLRPLPIRTRTDSTGSTRAAFLPSPTKTVSPTKSASTPDSIIISPDAKENHGRRRKKRTPKKAEIQTPSPEKLHGADMDLGDMASLALAGIGADDLDGLVINGTSNQESKNKTPRHDISPAIAPPPRHPPHPFASPSRREALQRESSVLSDDNYFRYSEKSLKDISTLESSDSAVADLPSFAHINKKFGANIREDSLQYSDNFMGSILTRLSYQSSGGGEGVTPTSRLFGASLLDDMDHVSDNASPAAERDPIAPAIQPRTAYGSVAVQSSRVPYNAPPSSSSFDAGHPTTMPREREDEILEFAKMVQQASAYEEPTNEARATPVTPPTMHSRMAAAATEVRIEPKPPATPPSMDEPSYQDSPFGKDMSWQSSTAFYVTDDEEEPPQEKTQLGWWSVGWWDRVKAAVDPTPWFEADIVEDEDGGHYEEPKSMLSRALRQLLYTPEIPEFSSLQQFCWAILLGIFMGIYTAMWKNLIEACVEFTWKTVPETLYRWGFFSDLDGPFPLPHYMWICPSIFGGVLSYIFVKLPNQIPGQNEWIKALHSRGVQDHETFWTLFFLSTAGMASGLSLGPELPLVLTAGMIGSYLGVATRQSILSARAMNLTAASAAVAGFFGFPMAGALFVLEIPHRMGLQYFEALSPATIASIVAVLVNRMILQNDVTGYYNYPFLTTTLPSHIFYIAIVYGLVGALVGVFYCDCVKYLKTMVHDWFHVKHDEAEPKGQLPHQEENASVDLENQEPSLGHASRDETLPLVVRMNSATTQKIANKRKPAFFEELGSVSRKFFSFGIAHEPTRAAVAGTLAGFLTGVICMFVPHVLFWGEAQLQTLIDKGRTPLPVFGATGERTADLTAYGYCLIDPTDLAAIEAGFNVGCAAMLSVAKIVVVGLSLGTGIVGGHFWGPLFVGCVASHLFTNVMEMVTGTTGFGANLSAYPCVAILCIMGSSHVVTFRAHMAIMLILTLTISAFYPDQSDSGPVTAGDYSAVFPLLVVSCFVSVMVTRGTVFYKEQRSRGDIMAAPEVLCEPGKEGTPMVVDYVDDEEYDSYEGSSTYSSSSDDDDLMAQNLLHHSDSSGSSPRRSMDAPLTQGDIEEAFLKAQQNHRESSRMVFDAAPQDFDERRMPSSEGLNRSDSDRNLQQPRSSNEDKLSELLSKPFEKKPKSNRHRRVRSTNDVDPTLPPPSFKVPGHSRSGSMSSTGRRSRSNSVSSRKSASEERLMRVSSFGELKDFHPSLFDHARQRSASTASMVNRPPSLPKSGRHSRKSSEVSASGYSDVIVSGGVLSHEDVERSFGTMVSTNSSGGSQEHVTSTRMQ